MIQPQNDRRDDKLTSEGHVEAEVEASPTKLSVRTKGRAEDIIKVLLAIGLLIIVTGAVFWVLQSDKQDASLGQDIEVPPMPDGSTVPPETKSSERSNPLSGGIQALEEALEE